MNNPFCCNSKQIYIWIRTEEQMCAPVTIRSMLILFQLSMFKMIFVTLLYIPLISCSFLICLPRFQVLINNNIINNNNSLDLYATWGPTTLESFQLLKHFKNWEYYLKNQTSRKQRSNYKDNKEWTERMAAHGPDASCTGHATLAPWREKTWYVTWQQNDTVSLTPMD